MEGAQALEFLQVKPQRVACLYPLKRMAEKPAGLLHLQGIVSNDVRPLASAGRLPQLETLGRSTARLFGFRHSCNISTGMCWMGGGAGGCEHGFDEVVGSVFGIHECLPYPSHLSCLRYQRLLPVYAF